MLDPYIAAGTNKQLYIVKFEGLINWVQFNVSLAAIWDAHVKDMGKAVCGSSPRSLTQKVTSDMKFIEGMVDQCGFRSGLDMESLKCTTI